MSKVTGSLLGVVQDAAHASAKEANDHTICHVIYYLMNTGNHVGLPQAVFSSFMLNSRADVGVTFDTHLVELSKQQMNGAGLHIWQE